MGEEAKETLGLFIECSGKELNPDEIYKISIFMLVDKIIMLVSQVSGIEVMEGSQVLSTGDISLYRYSELKQWDFDFISFINDENGKTADDIVV